MLNIVCKIVIINNLINMLKKKRYIYRLIVCCSGQNSCLKERKQMQLKSKDINLHSH